MKSNLLFNAYYNIKMICFNPQKHHGILIMFYRLAEKID